MTMNRSIRSHRERVLLSSLVLCASALWSCGGAKTADNASTATKAETPPATSVTAPPAQAANDPAKVAAPEAVEDHAYDPATATGAIKGIPAPTNTGAIEAVANFFTEIPGVDLATLDPHSREKFLHRVNSELCTCGCKNDTIARCAVNDPTCRVVKGLVQKVYYEVKAGR